MTWVIAILLGLILVALMSSDKAAASGVRKVVKVALIGALLLFLAGAVLFGVLLYYEYAKDDWLQLAGMALVVVGIPAWLWSIRKGLIERYRRDRRGSLKSLAAAVGYLLAAFAFFFAVREVLESYRLSGWWLVGGAMAFSGCILLWKSLTGPKGWREVWLGPAPTPDPSAVLYEEQLAMADANSAAWDAMIEKCQGLSMAEQESLQKNYRTLVSDRHARLASLKVRLEAEQAEALRSEQNVTVRGSFWLCTFIGAVGLVPVVWGYCYDYALGLDFVRGSQGKARAIVIAAGALLIVFILGALDGLSGKRDSQETAEKKADH